MHKAELRLHQLLTASLPDPAEGTFRSDRLCPAAATGTVPCITFPHTLKCHLKGAHVLSDCDKLGEPTNKHHTGSAGVRHAQNSCPSPPSLCRSLHPHPAQLPDHGVRVGCNPASSSHTWEPPSCPLRCSPSCKDLCRPRQGQEGRQGCKRGMSTFSSRVCAHLSHFYRATVESSSSPPAHCGRRPFPSLFPGTGSLAPHTPPTPLQDPRFLAWTVFISMEIYSRNPATKTHRQTGSQSILTRRSRPDTGPWLCRCLGRTSLAPPNAFPCVLPGPADARRLVPPGSPSPSYLHPPQQPHLPLLSSVLASGSGGPELHGPPPSNTDPPPPSLPAHRVFLSRSYAGTSSRSIFAWGGSPRLRRGPAHSRVFGYHLHPELQVHVLALGAHCTRMATCPHLCPLGRPNAAVQTDHLRPSVPQPTPRPPPRRPTVEPKSTGSARSHGPSAHT